MRSLRPLINQIEKISNDNPQTIDILRNLLDKISVMKGKDGYTPQKGLDYFTNEEIKAWTDDIINEVMSNINVPIDGKDGVDGKDGIDGKDGERGGKGDKGDRGEKGEKGDEGKSGSPDNPIEIRNKLESLEGNEKIAIFAIKGLRDELDKLEKKIKEKEFYMGYGGTSGSGTGGRIVKSYDLSGQLNGSTKTFSLPTFWRVISVHLSSFPNVLRETTDWTTDGSAMTITFTAQIDAPSSLATGQTCVVIYSEP